MKKAVPMLIVGVLILASLSAYGQMIPRQDAVWARTTTQPITLDGNLNEPAWAVAESVTLNYGVSSGMPGGGWVPENGKNTPPLDPTSATIKFLVQGDSLYVGIVCQDKSVGGGGWAHFDALLMNLRYRQATGFQGTPGRDWNVNQSYEAFYGWVKEGWADTLADQPGRMPFFGGFDGSDPYNPPRPDDKKAMWDGVTTVQGVQNDDATPDVGYTTELKFNLKDKFYDVTNPNGEVVMWNISIYDNDWEWPKDTSKQSSNRVWLQCPWGNAAVFSHMRIFVRPDVTTSSGAVPAVPADIEVPNAQNYAAPVIDGALTEPVWTDAPRLKIRYGDAGTRNTYPTSMKYRSGQVQPDVNGTKALVTDPSTANVKYFFKGNDLYLGFDVEDRVVQGVESRDRWDGVTVTFNTRDSLNGDNALFSRGLSFRLNEAGGVTRHDDLASWDSLGVAVPVAVALKPGTTVDTLGTSADVGYTAEMKIDLTKFGYPAGLGDGVGFLGITYYDGDSFTPFTNSYGTITWLGRRGANDDAPAWVWMNPNNILTSVDPGTDGVPSEFQLVGNYPNPFNPSTTIEFRMSRRSEVKLQVFDMLGRTVEERSLGIREPGDQKVVFSAGSLATGVYQYRLTMVVNNATVVGRMMLVK